jgi:hypothetical protein
VSEIDRLRFSIQDAEGKRILKEAKCHGAKEGLDETKSQIKLLIQDMLPKESISISEACKTSEVILKSFSNQIAPNDLLPGRLPAYCKLITGRRPANLQVFYRPSRGPDVLKPF